MSLPGSCLVHCQPHIRLNWRDALGTSALQPYPTDRPLAVAPRTTAVLIFDLTLINVINFVFIFFDSFICRTWKGINTTWADVFILYYACILYCPIYCIKMDLNYIFSMSNRVYKRAFRAQAVLTVLFCRNSCLELITIFDKYISGLISWINFWAQQQDCVLIF